MTLEEIREHRNYKMLTDAEQRFLEAYLTSNGDIEIAVCAGYEPKTLRSLRALGRKLLRRVDIEELVTLYFGAPQPTREQLAEYVWKQAKHSNGTKKVSLLNLYARLRKFDSLGHKGDSAGEKDDLAELISKLK